MRAVKSKSGGGDLLPCAGFVLRFADEIMGTVRNWEHEMSEAKPTLVERLKADLKVAMKERQSSRVIALRTMLSALDNASAVEVDRSFVPLEGRTPDVPRKELSEEEQLDILRREAQGRLASIHKYEQLGKLDEAARLRAELLAFAGYVDDVH